MTKLIIGCGYLGRRVARSWRADGHVVWALTRSSSRAELLATEGIHPIVGDVCEPSTLSLLPACDTMLFAVAVDRSSGRTQREVVVDGLRNVLKSAGQRTGRLISISSTSVYGQSHGEWVDESSECHPAQAGGECCMAAEELLATYSRSLTTNVLRLSGIYGPDRLLSRVESLRSGQVLSGSGEAWLNLIHVDDAVQAVRACEAVGEPGQTYLVSDDLPIRRADYYGLLARLVGAPSPTFDPDVESRRGSGGLNKRCCNTRLRRDLKVELTYPTIKEGVPQSLEASTEPIRPPYPAG